MVFGYVCLYRFFVYALLWDRFTKISSEYLEIKYEHGEMFHFAYIRANVQSSIVIQYRRVFNLTCVAYICVYKIHAPKDLVWKILAFWELPSTFCHLVKCVSYVKCNFLLKLSIQIGKATACSDGMTTHQPIYFTSSSCLCKNCLILVIPSHSV